MPGPLVMSALASHSPSTESVRARVRLLAKYGALLVLILVPALAQAGSAPALHNTVYDGIEYSMERGAQAFYFVPVAAKSEGVPFPAFAPVRFPPAKAAPAPKPKVVGKVASLKGKVTITRNGVTRPLTGADQIQVGDTLSTGPRGSVTVQGSDRNEVTLFENTKMTVGQWEYNELHPPPGNPGWNYLQGFFEWVSSKIGSDKNTRIETPVGNIGIRGTRFITRYDAKTHTMEIELISGSVAVKPKRSGTARTFTAPVRIRCTATSVTGSSLTREQFEASKAALLSP